MITCHLFLWALQFNFNCTILPSPKSVHARSISTINTLTQSTYNIPAKVSNQFENKQWFKYLDAHSIIVTYSKSKTNMGEDKKENFRMEIVKKTWFHRVQYTVKFTYHQCFAHAQLKLWNCVFLKNLPSHNKPPEFLWQLD